jgi:diadenosine tetraphosphate (Ap4A) HIT family hydrolase
MHQCEFCQEFAGHSARFEQLYGRLVSTRVIARTDRFVALPTLGQLFTGSLLILPVDHVEMCSSLSAGAREELGELVAEVTLQVREFGEPVIFEHGAIEPSGGGCGIYHAHLHIVPVPEPTLATDLFPEHHTQARNLQEAWDLLQNTHEYLLMSAAGQTLYSDLTGHLGVYPSQFFRRRIVEHFGLEAPWDWRAYVDVEVALLRTLSVNLPAHAR